MSYLNELKNNISVISLLERIKNGEDIAVLSKEIDFQIDTIKINEIVFLYISGYYRNEIEELLTDINYHSFTRKLEEFNNFLDEYFNR